MQIKDIPNEATVYTKPFDVDGVLLNAWEPQPKGTELYTHDTFPVVFCIDNDTRVWGIRYKDAYKVIVSDDPIWDWEPTTECELIYGSK